MTLRRLLVVLAALNIAVQGLGKSQILLPRGRSQEMSFKVGALIRSQAAVDIFISEFVFDYEKFGEYLFICQEISFYLLAGSVRELPQQIPPDPLLKFLNRRHTNSSFGLGGSPTTLYARNLQVI